MGLLHFLVPRRDRLADTALDRAYITGLDEVPWASRIVPTEDGLIVDRPVGESGTFYIPWQVNGQGELLLATGSLMERERPYLLEVELARGTLNRIRNQLANWEMAGMNVPKTIGKKLAAAVALFSRAATSQTDPLAACNLAGDAIARGLEITVALGASYAQQTLAIRHQSGNRLTTMLAATLGSTPLDDVTARHYLASFNTALLPFTWRQIEAGEGRHSWALTDSQLDWCEAHSLRVCSGPLIQFDGTDVPDWLYLWEEDAENLISFVTDYVRSVVSRYKGRVQVWQCGARINTGSFLGLSPQQRVGMVLRVVEVVRQLDPQTPVVVTLDQPWGEYISRQEADLPLHLADTLIRSEFGITGFGLEINLGFHPGGTQRRDVLEFSRQLDRWSLLGVPLLVALVVPGGTGTDAAARGNRQLLADGWTAERQDEWVRQYVPVMLSKQTVQAIVWNQLRDDTPHELPHGGLFDSAGQPKPALGSLAALRKAHLS